MDHFDIANTSVITYNKLTKTNRYIIDRNLISEEKCQQIIKVVRILVRHMIFQVCAKIIENIKNIIHSSDFLARYRNSSADFTRERKLPFSKLVLFFLNLNNGAPGVDFHSVHSRGSFVGFNPAQGTFQVIRASMIY